MKQIRDNYICYFCYGCNYQELEEYKPKRNCKDFIPAYKEWQEKYYKSLKGKK